MSSFNEYANKYKTARMERRDGVLQSTVVPPEREIEAHETTVSTTRNRALPLIIWSYASATFPSG